MLRLSSVRGMVAGARRAGAQDVRLFSESTSTSAFEERPVVSGVDMSKVLNSAAARTMSVSVANKKGELKVKINDAISKYKIHDTDRGSTGVQIAVLTEKINNLARHFLSFKKDKHSMRGYQGHINKRRKLMQYLKRKDFETFLSVVQALGLEKEATQLGGGRDK